jgi:hypothetical protein
LRSARVFAFDRAGRAAVREEAAVFFCGLAGADLRATVLLLAAGLEVLVAFLCVEALRAVVFFAVLALDETPPFDFVALRAGAFSAAERLMIGTGRALDLLPNVRLFPEDVEEV